MNEPDLRRLICWLDDVEDDGLGLLGGKGANLARLRRLGLPVPPGFVVTTEAYRAFLAANDLSATNPEHLRERILSAPIPDDVGRPIRDAFRRLGAPSVAVRSSGTAEDLSDASFAGQHDTFLNVEGPEAVVAAVRACWASLWSDRAVDYRRQRGWDDCDLALAVVVQTMVPAEWAGVLFTADPVTGHRDRLIVEAVRGLGETLVSGQATGSRQVVDRASGRVLDGNVPLPRSSLADLIRLAIRIEDAFGSPQDVEWALAKEHSYILQARPLTALPEAARPPARQMPRHYSRFQRAGVASVLDHLPIPPYPFDYSLFFRPILERALSVLDSLGLAVPSADDVFVEAADGVYQLVPPIVQPTFRALTLPLKLIGALRAKPDRWLADCRDTLVALVQQTDRENLSALSERDVLERIEALQRLQLGRVIPRFVPFARGLLASQALAILLRLGVGRRATDFETDLLAGVPCVTTSANRELERLARSIRASDDLQRIFHDVRPEDLPSRLGSTSAGRAVLVSVERFLEDYGWRETTMPSAALPAWRDDPSVVYGLLKGLVAGDGTTTTREIDDGSRAEDARSAVLEVLSRRWFGLGKRLVPLFLRVLAATRAFIAFREDSHYYLFTPFSVVRRLALELGQRLADRGALDDPADVFYLTFSELRDPVSPDLMRKTARQRKAARQSLQGRLTAVPADLVEQTSGPGEFRGVPVSRGQAIGPVRIILSERDFWTLQKGDVLVAPYTNPSWTPLFALAAAVIVDAGGTASHAAIVAREYGLPAVMGTVNATTRLRDGQRVLVDGDAGRVVPV